MLYNETGNESAKAALTGILGQFNPALGGLANIAVNVAKGIGGISVSLLATLGTGVAIAGIVKLFENLHEAAQRAEEAIKRVQKARDEFAKEHLGPLEQITADLTRVGGFSRENLRGAWNLAVAAMGQGVPERAAAERAGVSFAAGLTPDDLALLAAAGKTPKTTEEARKALAEIRSRPEVSADVQRQAQALRESRGGAQAILQAAMIRREMQADPRYWEKMEGVSQDVLLLERGKELGLLKEDAGVGRIDEIRQQYGAKLQELKTYRAQLALWRRMGAWTPERLQQAEWLQRHRIPALERELALVKPLFDYSEALAYCLRRACT